MCLRRRRPFRRCPPCSRDVPRPPQIRVWHAAASPAQIPRALAPGWAAHSAPPANARSPPSRRVRKAALPSLLPLPLASGCARPQPAQSEQVSLLAASVETERAFFHYFHHHFARPCSLSAFRVNFYVSITIKTLTLADCFKLERKNGPSMKIHEYQAKAILSRYGVTTPRGEVAFTREEAREAAHRLRSHVNVVVVKAQIHAGGRGKAGGVKLARSSDEAADLASHILGMKLVTPQTGPAGRIVKRLLIEEGLDIKRELYLGLLVDRGTRHVVFMPSAPAAIA